MAEEKARVKAAMASAKAAEEAVLERRRKTEAVYAEIDKRADERVAEMAEKQKVVAARQAVVKAEIKVRNEAKQAAARERIASVLEAQAEKQRAKRAA